jgi:hypothetical protein
MLSYREQLAKVGIGADATVSHAGFFLAPRSLRATMLSANTCQSFTQEVPGDEWDANWTEEIQGVAFKAERWFFVQNASDQKRLYVLRHGDMKKLKIWDLKGVPAANIPGFKFYHFGAVQVVGDELYIDHWFGDRGQILVMRGDENAMNFVRWIDLQPVPGVGNRMGMVAVNAEAGRIITSGGEKNIKRLCLHDLNGVYMGKTLELQPGIDDGCYVQGGFWSPNNLIYVSSGQGGLTDTSKGQQYIYYFSPLSGRMMGAIGVRSKEGRQELEGCCYAAVQRDGRAVQIHVVLLENEAATDDIYFKSFSGSPPENI